MIRLLKWILIIALVLTIVLYAASPGMMKPFWYINVFFMLVIIGWLASYFYNRKAFWQVVWLIELIFYFSYELFKASFEVAYEVLTLKHHMEAGIVAVPLDTKTDLEITIFSSLVSLTPGTLSIDVSVDKSVLYVHAMYISKADAPALANELKSGFEQRIIRIFRN
jgi:multicomponent Na+:H+ antiporter subunit E